MQQNPQAVNQNLNLQTILEIVIRNIPVAKDIAEAHGFTIGSPRKVA
jgi:hypothetical protein